MAFEMTEHGQRLRHYVLRTSRSRLQYTIAFFSFLLVIWLLSPYDSMVRTGLRFQSTLVADYFQHNHPSDSWLLQKQRYPIDPVQEVGIVLKTGYGTRKRVPKALAALGNETFDCDIIVIQDYPVLKKQDYALPGGKKVPAVDIIGWMLDKKMLEGKERVERLTKYKHLSDAIEAEEWFVADGLGKGIGWEMDALKFISGLQYVWENMPKKAWYIMSDDDTYVIKESLNLVLGHLNPAKPHYLGNPVGDYKARFGHGGSSVVLSGATLSMLFDRHPEFVKEAHLEAPFSTFGDKLLSETLMKMGVYLDESWRRLFNGEPPHMTRMWADRFCYPLVSFHGLGSGDMMEQTGNTFKNIKEPVFWRQMGKIYGASDFETFVNEPIRVNQDFVGRVDEQSTSVENVESPEACMKMCTQGSPDCLAWTWEQAGARCHLAPWAIIGDYREGVASGINAPLARELSSACHTPAAPVLQTE